MTVTRSATAGAPVVPRPALVRHTVAGAESTRSSAAGERLAVPRYSRTSDSASRGTLPPPAAQPVTPHASAASVAARAALTLASGAGRLPTPRRNRRSLNDIPLRSHLRTPSLRGAGRDRARLGHARALVRQNWL